MVGEDRDAHGDVGALPLDCCTGCNVLKRLVMEGSLKDFSRLLAGLAAL
jgi:hypothetical protein